MSKQQPATTLEPHNHEAEEAVLSSIIVDSDAIYDVVDFLEPKDFFIERHAWVYEAMIALHQTGIPCADLVLLSGELQKQDRLMDVGGMAYLIGLAAIAPSGIHAKYYGKIVEETSQRRQMIKLAGKMARAAFEGSNNVLDLSFLVTDMEKVISQAQVECLNTHDAQELEKRLAPTEYLWHPYIPYGEISAIGGREGTGKTALVQDLIRRCLNGHPMPDGQTPHLRTDRILFIDAEDFVGDWIGRMRQWQQCSDPKFWHRRDGLEVLTYPKHGLLDFAQPEQQDRLFELCLKIQPTWINLDSWQASLLKATFDEQIAHVIAFFKRLVKELNCAFTTTLQLNKDDGSPYSPPNSTSFKGAGTAAYRFRATFGMYRMQLGGQKDLKTDPRILQPIRISSAQHPDPIAFTFEPLHPTGFYLKYHKFDELQGIQSEQPDAIFSTKSEDCEGFIINSLTVNGPQSYADLKTAAKNNGIGFQTFDMVLKELKADGRIMSSLGEKKKGNKLILTEGFSEMHE